MKCQKLLITSLLILGLSIPTSLPTFACESNSSQDDGAASNDNNDSPGDTNSSSGNNDASDKSSSSSSSATGQAQASDGNRNGPLENPCDYYWNWGSAKYKCPKDF